MGLDSNSFLPVIGAMVIYVSCILLTIFVNEAILNLICLKKCRCKKEKDENEEEPSERRQYFEDLYTKTSHASLFNNIYEILDAGLLDLTIGICLSLFNSK
jgi:hypothetical protein